MNALSLAFVRFFVRWIVCTLGLWIAAGILGSNRISYSSHLGVLIVSGLILAIVNLIIKPFVVVLALPAILLSLGLFMIIINGLMVYIASKLYTQLHVTDFLAAVLAGMIIGLVNYLVTVILEER
jgi:putative membrane protein